MPAPDEKSPTGGDHLAAALFALLRAVQETHCLLVMGHAHASAEEADRLMSDAAEHLADARAVLHREVKALDAAADARPEDITRGGDR